MATAGELWLEEHTRSSVQWIPLVLSGLGIVAILAVCVSPQRWTLQVLRYTMIIVCAGSVFGIFQHNQHNLGFELAMRPSAAAAEGLFPALRGTSPLLALGNLALAAVLSMGAIYFHPKLLHQG